MYVGNLEHYQGIDLLLEGFRHTLTKVPSANLVIVGGSRTTSPATADRPTASASCRGSISSGLGRSASLPGLLRQADVLVSPRLKGLNTPMKIYSYLDSGTAVLATRLRTHTQVLDDRTAYLVEPEPEPLGNGLADSAQRSGACVQRLATPGQGVRAARSSRPRPHSGSSAMFYDIMESKVAGARA